MGVYLGNVPVGPIVKLPSSDIKTISVNGELLEIINNNVDITVPTNNIELDNGADYATNTRVNEVEILAKGANRPETFNTYSEMIIALNEADEFEYYKGQNVMIVELYVPDLWISYVESDKQEYVYISDEAFAEQLKSEGSVQIGYYKVSALETQKVDLSEYPKKHEVVASVSELSVLYATNEEGDQTTIEYSLGAESNTIAYRSASGTLSVNTPTENEHATTKLYVDTGLSNINQTVENVVKNITQIKTEDNSFSGGGATTTASSTVTIGDNAQTHGYGSIAIGKDSNAQHESGVAIGRGAITGVLPNIIQLGTGTNNHEKTLQVMNDNIYNIETHTLTVQNIELNGTNINKIIPQFTATQLEDGSYSLSITTPTTEE